MKIRPSRFATFGLYLLVGTAAILAVSSDAATPGTDDASLPVYKKDGTSNWVAGGGGSAFKDWKLVPSGANSACGYFIGDSRDLTAGSGGDINANGKSFGMFGRGETNTAEAYRTFDAPLTAGQTFSIELAVNYRNGQKGFDLRNAAGDTLFNLNVGSDDYVVNTAASGNGSLGNDYHGKTVFKLSFTQTGSAGGTWTITRSGGISKTATGKYLGVAAGLKLYVIGTDEGQENSLMVNHLTIAASHP